jgi:hypothetical protein
MARVNIEESAFVMAQRLGHVMGWDEDQTLGKLARFWRDSQAEEMHTCSSEDLAIWFRIHDEKRISMLIVGLLKAKTIEPLETGSYLIRGNQGHIDRLKQRREAASSGGKKSSAIRKTPNEPNAQADAQANATPDAQVLGQVRTEQSSSEQSKDTPAFSADEALEGEDSSGKLPKIAEIWNRKADSALPRVRGMNYRSTRARACRQRWKEKPDEVYWESVVERLNKSPFLTGKTTRWKADIEFLTRPDKHQEILEGKYDNPGAGKETKLKTLDDLEAEDAAAQA